MNLKSTTQSVFITCSIDLKDENYVGLKCQTVLVVAESHSKQNLKELSQLYTVNYIGAKPINLVKKLLHPRKVHTNGKES